MKRRHPGLGSRALILKHKHLTGIDSLNACILPVFKSACKPNYDSEITVIEAKDKAPSLLLITTLNPNQNASRFQIAGLVTDDPAFQQERPSEAIKPVTIDADKLIVVNLWLSARSEKVSIASAGIVVGLLGISCTEIT